MRFTDHFIRRPVMATVLSLLILLVGLAALFSLPVRQYPELSNTTITVTTSYPGASAELVKGFITTPIEQAVSSTEGLDTLTSSSRQSVSTVTLNLKLNADADRAATDVLSKVNQVRNVLPAEAKDPVVVKQTGEGFALMYLSFNSKEMNGSQITDYLTRVVQPKLQTVAGVASAQVFGGATFAMRVWLDPTRMSAVGVTADDVRNALANNNFTAAVGQVKGDFVQIAVNAHTSLDNVDAFRRLIVAQRGDAMIRLGDVASVELGPETSDSSSVFDKLKAVFIGIYATPSANPLTVITDVRKTMPEIVRQLPPSMTADVAYDSTNFIRASIHEVVVTLAEAAGIVIVVIFLFLGSLRSTFIPIVTIPLSLVGVLAMLLALGYSINLLTLLAMVLAIGLVVDDAIVVVENIHRHIEEGMGRFDAALQGAREIALPVIAMTITLAAVYAPIGFVSGLTGALFREFAFTLAGAVVVSGVVALTLSPMMCSRLLSETESRDRLGRLIDRTFDGIRTRYSRRLHKSLNFRAMTILILVAVVAMTGLLYLSTPKELAPDEDQGILFAQVKTPQYANLDYLEQSTEKLADIYAALPEAEHVFTINGIPDVHQAISGVLFKPWADRDRTAKQILPGLQAKIGAVPTVQAFAFSLPPLPGSRGGPPFQLVITTTADFAQLSTVAGELRKAAMQSGLFLFLDTDLRFDLPQLEVKIDQDKASRLGWSMRDIGGALATLLGGNNVNRFSLQGRSYEVIPQVPRDFRLSADWLERYRIRTASGELVPLSTVVTISQSVQPNALTGFQQLNAATLSGVPFPGRTMGEAYDFMRNKALELMPAGYGIDTQGATRQYVQEGNTLVYAFGFALIVIFLVLSAQYESFRDPVIILIALPTSMFGALLPLNILGFLQLASVNIYTQIGLVTLIGLISKHGILMVDFANRLQEEGKSRREAIEEAAAVRLRPILMTTAAMVLATLPLLLAVGAGARSRFDLGIVIAAGMTIGTMFTLFVTPAVYTLVARDRSAMRLVAQPAAGE